MAWNKFDDEFIYKLTEYAEQYIDECISSKKEVATSAGKIVHVKERHLPTIAYFLGIWLPRHCDITMTRQTYYNWLRGEDETKQSVIKLIDDQFQALAVDIVANEGKGIFYAKNKLGMTDKFENKNEIKGTLIADFGTTIQPSLQPGENSQ